MGITLSANLLQLCHHDISASMVHRLCPLPGKAQTSCPHVKLIAFISPAQIRHPHSLSPAISIFQPPPYPSIQYIPA